MGGDIVTKGLDNMKPLYMQDFKRQDHVSIVGEMHEMRTSRGQRHLGTLLIRDAV
jgi:hypothetical protein